MRAEVACARGVMFLPPRRGAALRGDFPMLVNSARRQDTLALHVIGARALLWCSLAVHDYRNEKGRLLKMCLKQKTRALAVIENDGEKTEWYF